jgi:hypothetical protein
MSRSEFVCVYVCVCVCVCCVEVFKCQLELKSDSSVRFGHGLLPQAVRVLRVVYDGFINC